VLTVAAVEAVISSIQVVVVKKKRSRLLVGRGGFSNLQASHRLLVVQILRALSAARSLEFFPMSRLLGLAVGFGFGFGFGFGLGCWVRLLAATAHQQQTPGKPSVELASDQPSISATRAR
jgi:hypothetical protein